MAIFKDDNALKNLFTETQFSRLAKLLTTCCGLPQIPCCATEKYTLSFEFVGCDDGGAVYNINVVSNTPLEGVINYTLFNGTFFVLGFSIAMPPLKNGIPAGKLTTVGTITISGASAIPELFVIDSRGNWSNTVPTLPIQSCD